MPDPLSISCPHCSASFKAKNAAAIGKKVKCPKCDEPFVIQKPSSSKSRLQKKKSKKVKPKLDFLDDESAPSTDIFEDDFDDWDDDLSSGPSIKPKKKQKPKTVSSATAKIKSESSLEKYGFSPIGIVITFLLLFLNLVALTLQNHVAVNITYFLSLIIGMGCIFFGGTWFFIIVTREGLGELILCLIVPFYSLYYAITRFETTKKAYATLFCGAMLYLGPVLMLLATNSITGKNPFESKFSKTESPTQSRQNVVHDPQHDPPDPLASIQLTSLQGINKFDLARVQPQLMTWPTAGANGFDGYREHSTKSIGNVFVVSNTRSFSGKTPAGGRMKFRVSLPPGADPTSPVPCILVPPAGSNLLTGRDIDLNDSTPHPEHEPYLKAGFAVVTFSLDGALAQTDETTNQQLKLAHESFRKSKAGLINCVHAFLETQAVIPGIDKNNIFIAGHSSAGTLSLLFAEHFPQIKGCLAYAPSVKLDTFLGEYLPEFKTVIPDIEDFLRLSSPQTHIKDLKCPVFLFHSRGDQVTSFQNTYQFASQLTVQGTKVEFVAGDGSDHYQTMIDEGLPKGIEWIKKQIKKTDSAQPAPQMAAASGNETKGISKTIAQTPIAPIDVTRRKATFKVARFDDFHTNAIKSNPEFWKKSLIDKSQRGLQEMVPGYTKGADNLDLNKMTFSFEFVGALPKGIPQKFAAHFFAKAIVLADEAPIIEIVNTDNNSRIMDSNFLTFRIRIVSRIKFNRSTSPKIIEANLKQIDRYVPDSLIMNYNKEWAYIKLKGIGDKSKIEREAVNAFQAGGITVTVEKIDLSPADLAMNNSATPTNTGTSNSTPATTTKLKYIIRYGVYGGSSFKESVKRSLKGFVWVDQKSIQFNPDTKEISFINRSPVDQGALNRALTRNKFFQLNITQEAVPLTNPKSEKEPAKAGTN